MKDPFVELEIISSEIWSEYKAIKYNSCNKKKAILRIEKLIIKIKSLELDREVMLLKELINIDKTIN
jgi:hypothetical protein